MFVSRILFAKQFEQAQTAKHGLIASFCLKSSSICMPIEWQIEFVSRKKRWCGKLSTKTRKNKNESKKGCLLLSDTNMHRGKKMNLSSKAFAQFLPNSETFSEKNTLESKIRNKFANGNKKHRVNHNHK